MELLKKKTSFLKIDEHFLLKLFLIIFYFKCICAILNSTLNIFFSKLMQSLLFIN